MLQEKATGQGPRAAGEPTASLLGRSSGPMSSARDSLLSSRVSATGQPPGSYGSLSAASQAGEHSDLGSEDEHVQVGQEACAELAHPFYDIPYLLCTA